MKKPRKFMLLVLMSIIAIALVFVGMNAVQAHAKSQKGKPPGKPKPAKWAIRIPVESINLWGMHDDYIYTDGDDYITVFADRYSSSSDECFYWIRFWIYSNPGPDVWARFQDISLDHVDNTDESTPCGFPPPYDESTPPECVSDFLNNEEHPALGYEHLMITVRPLADIEDIILFPLGIMVSVSGVTSFNVWNRYECDNENRDEYYYHTITGGASVAENEGLYVERTSENTWKIYVESLNFIIKESYCEEVPVRQKGKSGKWSYKTEDYYPFEGTANLSYTLELIKIQ